MLRVERPEHLDLYAYPRGKNMKEKEFAHFNNYPIYGEADDFIELLSSILARINNTQEDENETK